MFKNSVLKSNVNTVEWLKKTAIRTVKTFAETMLGFVIVGSGFTEVDWIHALSVSGVACVACVLVNIAGIPEVKSEEESDE